MKKWFRSKTQALPAVEINEQPTTLLSDLKTRFNKTKEQFGKNLARILLGKQSINVDVVHELETFLIQADIGIETTTAIIDDITDTLKHNELADGKIILTRMQTYLTTLLLPCQQPLVLDTAPKPFVIMIVGVNGVGKTTTIGKLAHYYQQQGKKVMLAAGDTFRAAAVEQLQLWGQKNQTPVIAQHHGADSASVIFDALQAAQARGIDIVIADTAGRLHTQTNLMTELQKIKRVLQKLDPLAPHETMLILDANIGQNALNQANQFHTALNLSSITLTKLDGTAKGGILFALAKQIGLPIRFLGLGENQKDLIPFDATNFVTAIFQQS